MRHIPNILSFTRLLMVGVFVYFFNAGQMVAALATFVAAILTDILDGYLARRNNWISDLGKVLDPLADKLMLLAALICFYIKAWIPLWLLVIVLAKEVIMIVGGALLLRKNIVVYADWYGKFATGFFNLGVAATFLKYYLPVIGIWNIVLLSIAMVLAIIALIHYVRKQVLNQKSQL